MRTCKLVFLSCLALPFAAFAQYPGTSFTSGSGGSNSSCAADDSSSPDVECLLPGCALAVKGTTSLKESSTTKAAAKEKTPAELCMAFNDKHTDCPNGGPCFQACTYMKRNPDGCGVTSGPNNPNPKGHTGCEARCHLLFKETGIIPSDLSICELCCDVACGEGPDV